MRAGLRNWYVLSIILCCIKTASGAEGIQTHHHPFGLPIGIATTVPVRFENPEKNISYSGYLEVNRLHPLAGTTLGICSALLIKLIELPFAPRPPQPPEVALSMLAMSTGFSVGLKFLQILFPESSPLFSEVRWIQSRRQMFGQYTIQFANPEMRRNVRENLKLLGKLRSTDVSSIKNVVLEFDSNWICQEATVELPQGYRNLAIPLPTGEVR